MNRILICLLVFIFPSMAFACDKPRKIPEIKRVTLAAKSDSPAFYYHFTGYVVFIEPDWLINQLQESISTQKAANRDDRTLKILVALLNQELPLKRNVDLYKYSFENSIELMRIIRIVHYALESGSSSVLNDNGVLQEKIEIKIDYGKGMTTKEILVLAPDVSKLDSDILCIEN